MHRGGIIFGLFLLIMAGIFAGCTPSGPHEPAAKSGKAYVEPPSSADPLAEAAHDAFIRGLKQAGWSPMASPDEAELRICLSFHVNGASQCLVVTLDDTKGRRLKLLAGGFSRDFFWTASLAAAEAQQLAGRLGPPPGCFDKDD